MRLLTASESFESEIIAKPKIPAAVAGAGISVVARRGIEPRFQDENWRPNPDERAKWGAKYQRLQSANLRKL